VRRWGVEPRQEDPALPRAPGGCLPSGRGTGSPCSAACSRSGLGQKRDTPPCPLCAVRTVVCLYEAARGSGVGPDGCLPPSTRERTASVRSANESVPTESAVRWRVAVSSRCGSTASTTRRSAAPPSRSLAVSAPSTAFTAISPARRAATAFKARRGESGGETPSGSARAWSRSSSAARWPWNMHTRSPRSLGALHLKPRVVKASHRLSSGTSRVVARGLRTEPASSSTVLLRAACRSDRKTASDRCSRRCFSPVGAARTSWACSSIVGSEGGSDGGVTSRGRAKLRARSRLVVARASSRFTALASLWEAACLRSCAIASSDPTPSPGRSRSRSRVRTGPSGLARAFIPFGDAL